MSNIAFHSVLEIFPPKMHEKLVPAEISPKFIALEIQIAVDLLDYI